MGSRQLFLFCFNMKGLILASLILSIGTCKMEDFLIKTKTIGELLYKADGFSFYKSPVPFGVRLVNGAVANTCENVGLKAACHGFEQWNSVRCLMTNLDGAIMKTLVKILCNSDASPNNCPQLNDLFQDTGHWSGGECGIADGKWRLSDGGCAAGKNYVSTKERPFYAF